LSTIPQIQLHCGQDFPHARSQKIGGCTTKIGQSKFNLGILNYKVKLKLAFFFQPSDFDQRITIVTDRMDAGFLTPAPRVMMPL